MRAVVIETFGPPDGLAVVELADPVVAEGQVLVATEAIGVGGVDALIRGGALAAYGFAEGHVPGGEVAGTVTAVGAGVDPAWVGRRVWAFAGLGGGYAEQVVAGTVVELPDGISAADAVTLGSSGAVAHFGLRHARFAAGESVLVRGAAGGIGTMAVQLAARGGAATVAVTTSSPERGERLRELGATHVLDRSGAGHDDGFDVIVDVVAGPDLTAFYHRLNPNGRMVVVGVMGGRLPADLADAIQAAFRKSTSLATFSTDTIPAPQRDAAIADLLAAGARGELTAVVHDVLPLDDVVLAHRKLDDGEVFGRLVLTP